eukprot:scaffold574910_cov27-Prasinocladus_malaysianus.AAC.1
MVLRKCQAYRQSGTQLAFAGQPTRATCGSTSPRSAVTATRRRQLSRELLLLKATRVKAGRWQGTNSPPVHNDPTFALM